MASIYDHPATYDLEHSGPQPDIGFFVRFAQFHKPARILEYACGNGRLTIPVAEAASEWAAKVSGVDVSRPMLEAAKKTDGTALVDWREGDVASWRPAEKVDFIFSGGGSMSHLTSTDRQIAVWRNAFQSLAPGGRFIVAESMPDYLTLAESMRSPSHSALCLDGDFEDEEHRLLRCRAAHYRADLQRMKVRYFYDRFSLRKGMGRFVDDHEAHIYFPNELRLLFQLSGFEIEAEWGDYEGTPLSHRARALILCGIRAE